MSQDKLPDCLSCRHFYVTWDSSFPRGCRVFNFKSAALPAVELKLSTGKICPAYQASAKVRKK